MSPTRRQILRGGISAAAVAALVRSQGLAAASTAMYRNQLVDSVSVPSGAADAGGCCAIVELRQYTLHPQRFDGFARLFEDEFLDPLEATGMTVIGEFRDLDDPNRFVWLRGFPDMPSRATALAAFYDGPVWKARRDAANANFTDTDNVLLLHPSAMDSGLRLPGPDRPATRAPGRVMVTVYPLEAAQARSFPGFFAAQLKPELIRVGIDVAATFETEASANTFPRLPVREGEHVFVWIARFADPAIADAALQHLTHSERWHEINDTLLRERMVGAPQVLRLEPLPRSRLRG